MNSLRRDLLERRLWPVVAILVLAIAAVPFVLRKQASASVDVTPAPPAVAATAATATVDPARVHALEVSLPRDPFASGMPKLSAKPESKTKSSSTSTSASTAATSSTTTPTAAMVSPSPATGSSSASTGTSAGSSSSSSSGGSLGGAATVTTTTTVTAPSTTTTGTHWASTASVPSWTIYSVALRFGSDSTAPVRSDVARLTPLPSVARPRVMFMGVLAGGQEAVFALGAGVQHAGPGLCRPSRARCAALVLRANQVEQITVPATAASVQQQLTLSLQSISSRVTHSRQAALAAFDRHSAAGLCELDLADPVSYSPADGTLASVAAASDCKGQTGAVPFPGTLTAP